jgi:hypothetical protein
MDILRDRASIAFGDVPVGVAGVGAKVVRGPAHRDKAAINGAQSLMLG